MSAILFGIGNPLFDLSLKTDDKILKKYDLKANDVYLASPKTLPLFDEIVLDPQLQKIPGGSSQNAIRAFQWLSTIPKSAGYTGSVADDSLGDQQRELMLKADIDVQYYVAKGDRTGKCAALITGDNRCLIADIAGASSYNPTFIFNPALKASLDAAKVVYAEGFFVDVSVEALLVIAHNCVNTGRAFGLNLSAGWVVGKCLNQILELLPFVTYLFCNEDEARAFGKGVGWSLDSSKGDQDVQIIAQRLALLPKVDGKPRVVVITQGKDNVILATVQGPQAAGLLSLPAVAAATASSTPVSANAAAAVYLKSYPVPVLGPTEFKDSNGCGDSFVGGFFAALLLKNRTLDESVEMGIRMAQQCARHEGVLFGEKGSLQL